MSEGASFTYRDGTTAQAGDVVIGKTMRAHPVLGVLESLITGNGTEQWNCRILVKLRLYNGTGKISRVEPPVFISDVPDLAHTTNLMALHLPEPLREEHLWT